MGHHREILFLFSQSSLTGSCASVCSIVPLKLIQIKIFYISLVGGGFIMYYFIVLPRLPLHHQFVTMKLTMQCTNVLFRIISWIIVSCTLASFFIASFSDPGRITKENLHQYEENYEFDGVLYVPKTCRTCLIKRLVTKKAHCCSS